MVANTVHSLQRTSQSKLPAYIHDFLLWLSSKRHLSYHWSSVVNSFSIGIHQTCRQLTAVFPTEEREGVMNSSSDHGQVARGWATVLEDAGLVLLAAMFPCFCIIPRVVLLFCAPFASPVGCTYAIISFRMSYTH